MKLIKFLLKMVVALVLIAVIGVVVLLNVFNPNDYKPQIVQAVKDQTGRTLLMEGDIELGIFPRLGLSIGKTELSNAGGFQSRVFAQVDKIDVGLQIIPLFSGRVELDQMVLSGMVANLEINSDGRTNWDDLAQLGQTEASDPEPDQEADSDGNDAFSKLPPLRFQGIRIDNAQVSYTDRAGGTAVLMDRFNFSTGVVELWQPIDFEGDFHIENTSPRLAASFNYSGILVAKVLENQFGLQDFKLELDAEGETIPNGAIALNITAEIAANTARETAELEQLTIIFDDTTISGQASVKNFAKPAVQFAVNVDQLNADRYIPKTSDASDSQTEQGADTESNATADTDTLIELPMQMLRDLNMDGELTVGAFQVMNLKTQNFKAVLSAHNGVIELKPLGIEMYEGRFDGGVKLIAVKDVPEYQVQASLKDLQVKPLMMDFMEMDLVEGKGEFDLTIRTHGDRVSRLKRNLNGRLSAVFADGTLNFNMFGGLEDFVNGVNDKLNKVSALSALAGKQDTVDKIAKAQNTDTFARLMKGKTTQFNALKVSGNIANGVIRTNDLDVQSDDFSAQGRGSVDVATEYLDMELSLQQDEFSCSIPLKGKIAEIDYARFAKRAAPNCLKAALKDRLDSEKERLKAEAEARLEAEKAKAKARIEEEKAKAKARLEAEKAKAEAELKAKIEKEKQKAKDKLNEKLGDALKGLF